MRRKGERGRGVNIAVLNNKTTRWRDFFLFFRVEPRVGIVVVAVISGATPHGPKTCQIATKFCALGRCAQNRRGGGVNLPRKAGPHTWRPRGWKLSEKLSNSFAKESRRSTCVRYSTDHVGTVGVGKTVSTLAKVRGAAGCGSVLPTARGQARPPTQPPPHTHPHPPTQWRGKERGKRRHIWHCHFLKPGDESGHGWRAVRQSTWWRKLVAPGRRGERAGDGAGADGARQRGAARKVPVG